MNKIMEQKPLELDEDLKDKIDEVLSLYFANPLILSEEDYVDSESFQSGVEKGMGIAGIFSTLVGNGIASNDAIDLITLMISAETNVTIAKLNKEAMIEAPPRYEFV